MSVTDARGRGPGPVGDDDAGAGKAVVPERRQLIRDFGGAMVLTMKALRLVPFTLRHYLPEVARQAGILVLSSSVVIWILMMTLAAEGSLQGHYILRQLGAQDYSAIFTSTGEYSAHPSLFGWALAAKVGCGLVAELGSMRISEEIDALEVMGMDPMELLVLPRIVGLVITLPLLTFFADVMGVMGGAVVSQFLLHVSPLQYFDRVHVAVDTKDLFVGLVKAPVFALIIAGIGCMHGLRVKGSAESVGRETTKAVVKAIFLVIVLDALFSILFEKLGL